MLRALSPEDSLSVDSAARIAALEMELRECHSRILSMNREYQTLQADRTESESAARADEIQRVFARLSGPLLNLMALSEMALSGLEVQRDDLLRLIEVVRRELQRSEFQMIGVFAETCAFDSGRHQRVGGTAVSAESNVKIRIPGLRRGEQVLQRAMVIADC